VVNHCAEHIYDNQTLFTAISRKSSLTPKHIYPFLLKADLGKYFNKDRIRTLRYSFYVGRYYFYPFLLKALLGKFKSGNWLFYPFKLKAHLGKVHIPVLRQIVGAS